MDDGALAPLHFGTDGIRGVTNQGIFCPEGMVALSRTVTRTLRQREQPLRIIIARDTRRSGLMLQQALVSGFLSEGAEVVAAEPIPTPALSLLTERSNFSLGIMITASHNPASDNGIKFFDKRGRKIGHNWQQQIATQWQQMITEGLQRQPAATLVGQLHSAQYAESAYLDFLKRALPSLSLAGWRIVVDCANGAAYRVAPQLLQSLGAETIVIGNQPDGDNINAQCGVLYPQAMQSELQARQAQLAYALDGDGDRIVLATPQRLLNGDECIFLYATDMQRKGQLRNNCVVVTEHCSMGLLYSLKRKGIQVEVTGVGDHLVAQRMQQLRASLGGESSGHIIFGEYSPHSDGLLAALQFLSRFSIADIADIESLLREYTSYAQVHNNLTVTSKPPLNELPQLEQAIHEARQLLTDEGRLLVRYSGTESKIRILTEHLEKNVAQQAAQIVTKAVVRTLQ